MTKYALKDIRPNPFRHLNRYPISRDKVEALRESLRATGYWGNVVARARPNGKAEVAYGHHRLVALREEYGPDHEVDLIVRKLSNEEMLQIMGNENMTEWAASADVTQETVRAVVEACAEGKITLPAVPKNTDPGLIRYAPSYVQRFAGESRPPRAPGEVPYTAKSVSNFLGWMKRSGAPEDKVYCALTALQYIEEGGLAEHDVAGLTTTQLDSVLLQGRAASSRHHVAARHHGKKAKAAGAEAKKARKRKEGATRESDRLAAGKEQREAEARQEAAERAARAARKEGREEAAPVMRGVAQQLRDGDITTRGASTAARRIRTPRDVPSPRFEKFTHKLMNDLSQFLDPKYDKRVEKLDEVIRFVDDLPDNYRESAAMTLRGISDRCLKYAEKIAPKAKPMKTAKAATKTAAKPAGEVVYLPAAKPRKRTRPRGKGAAPGTI